MSKTDVNTQPESPWVIVNCPSCEKKVKLPKDKLGSAKFKCPLCSEYISFGSGNSPAGTDLVGKIDLELSEEEEEEKEGFLSRIKTTNDEVGTEEQVIEKDGELLMKRRRRVRKKKKVDTGPDWESEEASQEEQEDKGGDEYSFVVDTDVDADGNVVEIRRRVKTPHRRTVYDKFSSKMAKVFWGFTVITGVALVLAVAFLMKAGRDSKNSKTEIVNRDTGQITSEITDEAFSVIDQYLTVNTWTEKVKLVRNPMEVRPLMEEHYEKNPFTREEGAFVIETNGEKTSRRERVARIEKADVLDMIFVAVGFSWGGFQYFALERKRIAGSDNKFEYLIDWEVSERYRKKPIQQFRESAVPGSTAEYRVSLQGQGTYFPIPFDDKQVWRCYRLTYPGDPDFELFGYTKDGTAVDDEVLNLFSTSGRPAPIIEVAFPDGKIYDSGAVEITKVVQTTWYK